MCAQKDLHEIPVSILRQVEIAAVEHMDQVLSHTLVPGQKAVISNV
jgi:ATP-dependent Lon protease